MDILGGNVPKTHDGNMRVVVRDISASVCLCRVCDSGVETTSD